VYRNTNVGKPIVGVIGWTGIIMHS
jgi:hypothetical protein